MKKIPSTEGLYLLGDCNGRIGADREAWPSCLAPQGLGKVNNNGQILLELCCYHRLCVTNTFFKCKEQHMVSWRHLRSNHWHQLDLVITRRADLSSVLLTRSYRSADCDTDHSPMASRIRLLPKKLHHTTKKGKPRINTCCATNPVKTQQFVENLPEALADTPIDSKWSDLRDAIYNSAINAYGKREHKMLNGI